MAVLATLLGMTVVACQRQAAPPAAKPAEVPVVTAPVARRDVPIQVRGVGTVEPYSAVAVKARVTGELTGVFFKDGTDVKAGDLLFTIDRRPFEAALSAAEANLARDRSQAENAAAQLQRFQALVDQGIATREQFDQSKTAKEASDAVIRADQAAVETAELQVQYCSIFSPLTGRTGNLLVNKGNLVEAGGATLVTINQIQPVYVTFSLPETSLNDVQNYLKRGALQADAILANQQHESGTLTFVDNTVDPSTGTIKLRATFLNPSGALWPGQFVDVVVTLTTRRDAIVVPSQAVQTGDSGQFVFVIKKDNTVQTEPVRVELTMNGQAVIATGLQPGEQVVIDGQSRLTPGSRVQLRSASL